MHYSCEKMPSDMIAGVDGFIQNKDNVVRSDASEIELKAGELSESTLIILLKSIN